MGGGGWRRTYYAHPGAVDGDDVLNGGVSFGLVQAVSAGLVEGAEGVGNKSSDVVLSAKGVVLKDFVLGVTGSSTDDAELGVETFGCEGVFADVFPPD